MMETILFATDGSQASEQGAAVTSRLMQQWPDAKLLVLYVSEEMAYGYDVTPDMTQQHEQHIVAQLTKQLLQSVFAQCAGRVDFRHETGSPARVICDIAQQEHAQVIVVGKHGHGRLDRMVLGSVSREVARRTSIPVMVVPSTIDVPSFQLSRVLFATDGSPDSHEAAEFTKTLMSSLPDAQLISLYVKDDAAYAPYGQVLTETAERERAWAKVLGEKLTQETFASLSDRHRFCEAQGDPAPAVCQIADAEAADLIVMGSRGFGAVNRFLIGSVSEGVTNRARVPVIVVRHAATVTDKPEKLPTKARVSTSLKK